MNSLQSTIQHAHYTQTNQMSQAIEAVVGKGKCHQEFQSPPDCRGMVERLHCFDEFRERSTSGDVGNGHDGNGRGENEASRTMSNRQDPDRLRTKEEQKK